MLDKVIVQTARQGQDPAQTENVSADLLTPWGEIPIACGFRVTRHKQTDQVENTTDTPEQLDCVEPLHQTK